MATIEAPSPPSLGLGGWWQSLALVYAQPGRAFRQALAAGGAWQGLLGLLLLNALFTGVWLSRADAPGLTLRQLEQSGQLERLPEDQRASVVARQAELFPVFAWVGGVLFSPLVPVVVAALFAFVFNTVGDARLSLARSLGVVGLAFLGVGLVATPLNLLTLFLRGEWDLDPRQALVADGRLLLDPGASHVLQALAGSLDLFTLWTLVLLSIGYGAALGRGARAAAGPVFGLWGLYVAGKVVLALLF